MTAGFENQPRRVHVDPHPEREVRFGHAAHDRGQMKNRGRVWVDGAVDDARVRDVADDVLEARIGQIVGGGRVNDGDPLDGPRASIQAEQRALLQQLTNEPAPDEAGAPSDHHLHVSSLSLDLTFDL